MSRAKRPAREDVESIEGTMRTIGVLAPGSSRIEQLALALQWHQLTATRMLTAELAKAGFTASQVLEVLLKQYSRLALATHAPEVK